MPLDHFVFAYFIDSISHKIFVLLQYFTFRLLKLLLGCLIIFSDVNAFSNSTCCDSLFKPGFKTANIKILGNTTACILVNFFDLHPIKTKVQLSTDGFNVTYRNGIFFLIPYLLIEFTLFNHLFHLCNTVFQFTVLDLRFCFIRVLGILTYQIIASSYWLKW